ncbi:Melanoma-associated antigen H1 [Manis javanica]|nr:Melanoma-associated antigen H1 [Manis javanica]
MATSVVPSTPEDDLSGSEENPSTAEKASTTPEEASSTVLAQKPSVARSNFQGTKKSLLMSILALIFIMGNSAKEALVWKVLGKLGMQPGQQHSIFGDPKKVVTEEFVRRGYLIYKQVPRSSPVEYEFFWGPRAHVESSKLKVLHFVARILGPGYHTVGQPSRNLPGTATLLTDAVSNPEGAPALILHSLTEELRSSDRHVLGAKSDKVLLGIHWIQGKNVRESCTKVRLHKAQERQRTAPFLDSISFHPKAQTVLRTPPHPPPHTTFLPSVRFPPPPRDTIAFKTVLARFQAGQ